MTDLASVSTSVPSSFKKVKFLRDSALTVQRTALHFGLFLPLLLKISPYGTKSPLCFGTSMFYFGSSLYLFHNLRKVFKYMPSFGLKNVTLSPSLVRKNSWIWLTKGIYKQIYLEKTSDCFHPPLEFRNGWSLTKFCNRGTCFILLNLDFPNILNLGVLLFLVVCVNTLHN